MKQPLVAVSTDTRHFEKLHLARHARPVSRGSDFPFAGVLPVLAPSFGERLDIDGPPVARRRRMLTRSKTNVNPPVTVRKPREKRPLRRLGATRPPWP